MIPSGALRFDIHANVASARANSGYVLFSAAAVDRMTRRARSENRAGGCITACIDTDGLALDPRGGELQLGWCNFTFRVPNLLFTTRAHTGAGVLSTRNFGEIARVNGCALARSCGAARTTTGEQMGLRDTGNVGTLNGLATAFVRPFRFALSTDDVATLGGTCEWYVATSMNASSVLVFAGDGALPVSPAWDIVTRLGVQTNAFPELFPNAIVHGPVHVSLVDDGWGGRVGRLSLTVPAGIAPHGLITQAFALQGSWQASTPMTFVE